MYAVFLISIHVILLLLLLDVISCFYYYYSISYNTRSIEFLAGRKRVSYHCVQYLVIDRTAL